MRGLGIYQVIITCVAFTLLSIYLLILIWPHVSAR